MSLNKTLDRLFDEIRREAKRNPDFADRLDAVLRLHGSRRDVGEEVIEDVEQVSSSACGGGPERSEGEGVSPSNHGAPPLSQSAAQPDGSPASGGANSGAPVFNPVGYYKREGEDALAAALGAHDLPTLQALVAEHNLDPSCETTSLDRDALAAHVITQAKRRAERDEKLFDY
jgi:hypothetical protein